MKPYRRQFRGCWCPTELFEAVEKGDISKADAWLALTIDSYVQFSGKDCFASSKFLAKKTSVHKDQIRVMLHRLKKAGIIIQTGFDGRRRFLRTIWSRFCDPAAFLGCGNSTHSYQSHQPACGESPHPACGQSPHSQHNIHSLLNNTLSGPQSRSQTESTSNTSHSQKNEHPRWLSYAKKLHSAIATVHKVNYTSKLHSWSHSFKLLHTKDGIAIPRIKSILMWYCKEFPNQDTYLPIANSGASFREKFLRIEAQMKRMQKEDEPIIGYESDFPQTYDRAATAHKYIIKTKERKGEPCPEGKRWGEYKKVDSNCADCMFIEECQSLQGKRK